MTLRQRIRTACEVEVEALVLECRKAVENIASGHGINSKDLLKLTVGGRTNSTWKIAVNAMVDYKEAALENLYEQAELDIQQKEKKK